MPNQIYSEEVWFRLFALSVAFFASWFLTDSFYERQRKFLLAVAVPETAPPVPGALNYNVIAFQIVYLFQKLFELMFVLTTWFASHFLDFFNGTGTCCSGHSTRVDYAAFAIVTLVFLFLYKSADLLYTMGTSSPDSPCLAQRIYLVMYALAVFLFSVAAIWLVAIYWSNFRGSAGMIAAAVFWTIYAIPWQAFIWYLTYVNIRTYYYMCIPGMDGDGGACRRQLGGSVSTKPFSD